MSITFEEAVLIAEHSIASGHEVPGVELGGAAGAEWDELPKMKAALPPAGRVVLDLARNELSFFANCIETVLRELAPNGSPSEESELHSRAGLSIEEAKELARELPLVEKLD